MRALVFHFSSLVGLLVFLNQLWHAADIERTLFMAFGTGLAMYIVLMVGFAMTQRILAATPPPNDGAGSAARPGSSDAGSKVRTKTSQAA